MHFLLLALLLLEEPKMKACTENAGVTFREMVSIHTPERGYSTVPYHLGRTQVPVQVKVYAHLGTVLVFDRPFDDVWAKDSTHWYWENWGSPEGLQDHRMVIISSVFNTPEPTNIFFQFGGDVLEVLVSQVPTMDLADRKVFIRVRGVPTQKQVVVSPAAKEAEPAQALAKAERTKQLLLKPITEPREHETFKHGLVTYQFQDAEPYILFQPHAGSPPMEVVELVRGFKRRSKKHIAFEYPVAPLETHPVDQGRFLLYPRFALDKKEAVYLRTKARGERTATYTKLKWGNP